MVNYLSVVFKEKNMRRDEISKLRSFRYPCFLIMYGKNWATDTQYDQYLYESLFHTQKANSYDKATEIIEEFFERYGGAEIDVRTITCYKDELFEGCL